MSTDYYATLGVTKTATPEEIKAAFRKLSLKHHPDKGGDPEVFKSINEANQVLSDPNKRKLYDTVGADGMKMYEGFSGENQEGLTGLFGCLACLGCFVGPLFIIQLIFIPVALEGDVDWSATTTLIPTFIFDGFLGLFGLVVASTFFNMSKEADWGQKLLTFLIVLRLLAGIGLSTAFHVLLVQKVDDDKNTWKTVFAPLIAFYAYEVFSSLFKALTTIRVYNRTANDSGDAPMGIFTSLVLIITSVATNGLMVAFFVLIALKKDGDFDGSWHVVIIPLWILLGQTYFSTIISTMAQNDGNCFSACCSASFGLAPFFIFLGLIAAKSEGEDYSWHEVFGPIYALLCLIWCAACCGGAALGKGGNAEGGNAEAGTNAGAV